MKYDRILCGIFLLVIVLTSSNLSFAQKAYISTPHKKPKGITLQIATRHDLTITNEFKEKFLSSSYAQNAGVTDIKFYYPSNLEGWQKLLSSTKTPIDVAWGGGPALFNTMDEWGLLKHINDTDFINYINSLIPDRLAGADMKSWDENGSLIWVANAISSFGFTVNHKFLDEHGLPVPHTWEELASPTYYISPSVTAVSMGDPPGTTSNTRIYQIILQAFGWEQGWSILTRMAANAGFYPGSVDTRKAAVSGEVGIAMTIDFYGVIAHEENPDCEYIIPNGESIVNGDPIAIGTNVANYEAAKAFIEYVSSPEGQAVWLTHGINRLPVVEAAFQTDFGKTRADIYKLYNETLQNKGIEFNETLATLTLDITIYYFHQTLVEEHNRLRQTWGEMVSQLRDNKINQTYFSQLVTRLGKVNMTLQQALEWNDRYRTDSDFAAKKDAEWRAFAREKYDSIYYDLGGGANVNTGRTFHSTEITFLALIFLAATPVILRRKKKLF